MAAEQGCIEVTPQHVAAKKIVITPAAQPSQGDASSRRGMGSRVVGRYKKVTVVGATLEIALGASKSGDMICWTSYS